MIRLVYQFETSTGRHALDDYVRAIEVEAYGYAENGVNTYLVGRLAVDQVLWSDAKGDGVSLFQVCDNDSQSLHDVHDILTAGTDGFREDLEVNEPVEHVLFFYRVRLHPDLGEGRLAIIDSVANLFGVQTLAVMWHGEGGFADRELAELGFAKIAGEKLVYRHSAFRTGFSDEYPRGLEIDLDATEEHEAWVVEEWGEDE